MHLSSCHGVKSADGMLVEVAKLTEGCSEKNLIHNFHLSIVSAIHVSSVASAAVTYTLLHWSVTVCNDLHVSSYSYGWPLMSHNVVFVKYKFLKAWLKAS